MIYLHTYDLGKEKKQQQNLLISNLSKYLDRKVSFSDIRYNKNGKPEIDGLCFSISHSKNQLIQAFTEHKNIGVDIEHINPKRKILALAKRYFHNQESQYLMSLTDNKAISVFFQLWTYKEAVCKAEGGRLWYYLQDNYLDHENKMATNLKGLSLTQIDIFENFSVSLASAINNPEIEISRG